MHTLLLITSFFHVYYHQPFLPVLLLVGRLAKRRMVFEISISKWKPKSGNFGVHLLLPAPERVVRFIAEWRKIAKIAAS